MGLLREKPVGSITITELTEAADVNRATFYSHYHDIYHMLAEVRQEASNMLNQIVLLHAQETKQGRFEAMLTEIFECIEANRDIFLAFFDGQAKGADEIANSLREGFLSMVEPENDHSSANIRFKDNDALSPHEYRFDFAAGGLAIMVRSWLAKEDRESIEQMVSFASHLLQAVAPSD